MDEYKFLEIVNEIQKHYPLAIAEKASISNTEYKRLFSRVKAKLLHMFPSLAQHTDVAEYFTASITGFLEKPIVMLKYIRNKGERDHFMQHASKFEQLVLESSKTRITNIRAIVQLIDLLEIEIEEKMPDYFYDFRNKVQEILDEQNMLVREAMYKTDKVVKKFDAKRIENARTLQGIVYDFCMAIATS